MASIGTSKNKIKEYWASRLAVMGKFDSCEEFFEEDYCFACGMEAKTERAHILARCAGGGDGADNLHLLCRWCHHDSEYLDSSAYWEWFTRRTALDCFVSSFLELGGSISTSLERV